MTTREQCRCAECAGIHADFRMAFGKWPDKTHEEGQDIQRKRDRSVASWKGIR